jgi:hypothetical protein
MTTRRIAVVAVLVLGLIIPLSGCKLVESLVDKYINENLEKYLDQTVEDTIDGTYQASWTLAEETCDPGQIGAEGVSIVRIESSDDGKTAEVLVDGWLNLPDAEVDGSTVRGTARGTLADDGTCDYDAVATVELTVDMRHKTISGTIEMSYAHQSSCAADSESSCDNVKVY